MNNSQPVISFVSPVYQSENTLIELVQEIDLVMSRIQESYEIILVDDRSMDNSWDILKELSRSRTYLKIARLSRNFGQHPAIMAGLSLTQGKWVVVMDCDLQDQPKEVEKLYNKAIEGYDVVLGKRKRRRDSWFKKISSFTFARIYGYFTETYFDGSIANFGIYSRKVIQEVIKMNDYIKSFPLFVRWVGYNSVAVEIEHAERFNGKTSYNYSKLLKLAFNTIISFSNKPLKLFVKFGLSISFLAFIVGLVTIYRYFLGGITVLGYSSLMVSIWFLSGIIITIIGVVGIYIGKIFDQSKGRNPYIIDEIIEYETK